MTPEEWQRSTDTAAMLQFLRTCKKATDRKLRLFGVACCRRIRSLHSTDPNLEAIEVAERYADGLASDEDLAAAVELAHMYPYQTSAGAIVSSPVPDVESCPLRVVEPIRTTSDVAIMTADEAARVIGIYGHRRLDEERGIQCGLLRDIIGNPFRSPPFDPAWLSRNEGIVRQIAETIYREREFTAERMAVLGAALSDAGCTETSILEHCSLPYHVKGCHVVDLTLGQT